MEIWLVLGILSYASYAISTSIDKYMMNLKYDATRTNSVKMFFNGVILLCTGLAFFELQFDLNLIAWSLFLGILYASSGIVYYNALTLKDVKEVAPTVHSLKLLLIFITSIIIFQEIVSLSNYIGLVLILIGVYLVLSKKGIDFPKVDKGIILIFTLSILGTIYALFVKKVLFDVEPINLAILMYLSTAFVLVIYQAIFKRDFLKLIIKFKSNLSKIFVASFFGAMGTLLLYSALNIGNASKVYPISAIEGVFIFIIASIFLKEKFYWYRLLGTIAVVAGIFLVSI